MDSDNSDLVLILFAPRSMMEFLCSFARSIVGRYLNFNINMEIILKMKIFHIVISFCCKYFNKILDLLLKF